MNTVNDYMGMFTTITSIGGEGIYAYIRNQFKSATSWTGWNNLRNTQKTWRITYVMGKTGTLAFKAVTTTGGILGGVTAAYSTSKVINEISNGGLENVNGWDLGDAIAGSAGTISTIALAVGASNPVGWAIIGLGATAYGVTRLGMYVYDNF